ncbi:prolyl 3-hydroxylase OGFOD1 isoform X3 [Ovis canadensis]|uniref:prolyl 3-hydroxylase OGFOD1 isoform X3 n=1 Tax=Ovis canadensis TaxID=37174 RepID=UPI003751329A
MNGKRPAEPGSDRAGKKVKKEVMAKFSDAVTEETLKKQVAEAWSRRTPFRHGKFCLNISGLGFQTFPRLTWSQPLTCPVLNTNSQMPCSVTMMSWKGAGSPSFFTWFLPGMRAWGAPWTCSALTVSEVLSEEKSRLSISGWFHGPSLTRPPTYFEPLIARSPHIPQDHEILYDWINPTYLDMEYQAQIQEEFEESSEILLKEFLQPEKFAEVCEALERGRVEWSSRGPPNKRFYEKAEESQLPDILRDCMALFHSEAMFLLLSNFTGLKLHFLAPSEDEPEDKKEQDGASAAENTEEGTSHSSSEPENSRGATSDSSLQSDGPTDPEEGEAKKESSVPTCQGELRHWKIGHYTLIHDNSKTEFALDLLLYCGCEGWKPEYGGFTSYIAKGEDEELLTVNPENNSLALVYRDRETLKFVKHINHRSLEQKKSFPNRTGFWDFSFVYYE